MFTKVHSSVTHNSQKPTKWPLMDEYIKTVVILAVKYYSAMNRNKLLVQATTWVNQKCIMLSERNNYSSYNYI